MSMKEDEFISGLRAIFAADSSLKPATVARQAGLDNASIRKMFDGSSTNPTRRTMEKIARYFGTSVEAIANGQAAQQIATGTFIRQDPLISHLLDLLPLLTAEERAILEAAAEGFVARHLAEAS